MEGVILTLEGQGGYETCTCTGSGTYLFPEPTKVVRPSLVGVNENCYYCWGDIPLGGCTVEIFDELICELEAFPGVPIEVIAECSSFPDEEFGYIVGWKYCCRGRVALEGFWWAGLCIYFNADNEMVVEFNVNGQTAVVIGSENVFEPWRRKYRKYKLPGSFPGPDDQEWCTWTFEFVEPWELDPNYPSFRCPPPKPLGGVWDIVLHYQTWQAIVPIDECIELLNEVELTMTSQSEGEQSLSRLENSQDCVDYTMTGTSHPLPPGHSKP